MIGVMRKTELLTRHLLIALLHFQKQSYDTITRSLVDMCICCKLLSTMRVVHVVVLLVLYTNAMHHNADGR